MTSAIGWIRTVGNHQQTHWIPGWIIPPATSSWQALPGRLKSLGGGRVLAGSPKASRKLTVHVQVYNDVHTGRDNRSYCLKINGAVRLRLRPSLKTISLAVDAHGSASPLKWVFQTGWSGVVEEVMNELMRGRVEERREREHQRQLLDFRPGGNTRKSRHWSRWPPVGTRGVRDMLIFCS